MASSDGLTSPSLTLVLEEDDWFDQSSSTVDESYSFGPGGIQGLDTLLLDAGLLNNQEFVGGAAAWCAKHGIRDAGEFAYVIEEFANDLEVSLSERARLRRAAKRCKHCAASARLAAATAAGRAAAAGGAGGAAAKAAAAKRTRSPESREAEPAEPAAEPMSLGSPSQVLCVPRRSPSASPHASRRSSSTVATASDLPVAAAAACGAGLLASPGVIMEEASSPPSAFRSESSSSPPSLYRGAGGGSGGGAAAGEDALRRRGRGMATCGGTSAAEQRQGSASTRSPPPGRDLYTMAQPLLRHTDHGSHVKEQALVNVRRGLREGLSPSVWRGPGMPLKAAIECSNLDLVAAFLAARADPNAKDAAGGGMLHTATRAGDVEIVRVLLAAGASPNLADGHGQTPLFFAPTRAICRALQQHAPKGNPLEVNRLNFAGQSALHIAARSRCDDAMAWLCSQLDAATVDLQDSSGFTAKDYASRSGVRTSVIDKLNLARLRGTGPASVRQPSPYRHILQAQNEIATASAVGPCSFHGHGGGSASTLSVASERQLCGHTALQHGLGPRLGSPEAFRSPATRQQKDLQRGSPPPRGSLPMETINAAISRSVREAIAAERQTFLSAQTAQASPPVVQFVPTGGGPESEPLIRTLTEMVEQQRVLQDAFTSLINSIPSCLLAAPGGSGGGHDTREDTAASVARAVKAAVAEQMQDLVASAAAASQASPLPASPTPPPQAEQKLVTCNRSRNAIIRSKLAKASLPDSDLEGDDDDADEGDGGSRAPATTAPKAKADDCAAQKASQKAVGTCLNGSPGWQKARRNSKVIGAMDVLLCEARGHEMEDLYERDWTACQALGASEARSPSESFSSPDPAAATAASGSGSGGPPAVEQHAAATVAAAGVRPKARAATSPEPSPSSSPPSSLSATIAAAGGPRRSSTGSDGDLQKAVAEVARQQRELQNSLEEFERCSPLLGNHGSHNGYVAAADATAAAPRPRLGTAATASGRGSGGGGGSGGHLASACGAALRRAEEVVSGLKDLHGDDGHGQLRSEAEAVVRELREALAKEEGKATALSSPDAAEDSACGGGGGGGAANSDAACAAEGGRRTSASASAGRGRSSMATPGATTCTEASAVAGALGDGGEGGEGPAAPQQQRIGVRVSPAARRLLTARSTSSDWCGGGGLVRVSDQGRWQPPSPAAAAQAPPPVAAQPPPPLSPATCMFSSTVVLPGLGPLHAAAAPAAQVPPATSAQNFSPRLPEQPNPDESPPAWPWPAPQRAASPPPSPSSSPPQSPPPTAKLVPAAVAGAVEEQPPTAAILAAAAEAAAQPAAAAAASAESPARGGGGGGGGQAEHEGMHEAPREAVHMTANMEEEGDSEQEHKHVASTTSEVWSGGGSTHRKRSKKARNAAGATERACRKIVLFSALLREMAAEAAENAAGAEKDNALDNEEFSLDTEALLTLVERANTEGGLPPGEDEQGFESAGGAEAKEEEEDEEDGEDQEEGEDDKQAEEAEDEELHMIRASSTLDVATRDTLRAFLRSKSQMAMTSTESIESAALLQMLGRNEGEVLDLVGFWNALQQGIVEMGRVRPVSESDMEADAVRQNSGGRSRFATRHSIMTSSAESSVNAPPQALPRPRAATTDVSEFQWLAEGRTHNFRTHKSSDDPCLTEQAGYVVREGIAITEAKANESRRASEETARGKVHDIREDSDRASEESDSHSQEPAAARKSTRKSWASKGAEFKATLSEATSTRPVKAMQSAASEIHTIRDDSEDEAGAAPNGDDDKVATELSELERSRLEHQRAAEAAAANTRRTNATDVNQPGVDAEQRRDPQAGGLLAKDRPKPLRAKTASIALEEPEVIRIPSCKDRHYSSGSDEDSEDIF